MNCKHCGAELVEGKPFCPSCGKSQEETPEIKEGAKATPGKIALAVAVVVVVLALLVAVVIGGMDTDLFGGAEETVAPTEAATEPAETVAATVPADGNPDDVTCKGTYTVTDEEAIAAADTVVATMGDIQLTNGELQVYYWEEVFMFLQQYGSYASMFGLDVYQPLDVQMCQMSETAMTWQQYFLDRALTSWQSNQAIALEGAANGFEMDADYQAYLDGLPAEMETMAAEDGYESLDAMIADFVGAGPSIDDYLNFIKVYYSGYAYYNHVSDSTNPTAEEVEAHFAENEAAFAQQGITKESGVYVDVRHILIQPEGGETGEDGYPVFTDEAWAAAKTEAEKVYDLFKQGAGTEDAFAQLAQEYSVDGSASNGGLYTNVYEGQMVENFNNWCFDAARQVGDHDLVQTQFGYHIMYFSGSRDAWFVDAEADLIDEILSSMIPDAMEKHPTEVDYSAIKLALVSLV